MPTAYRSRKRRERNGAVDLERVLHTTDEDIARQIAEDPDTAPELTDEDLDEAWIVEPDGTRIPYRERVSKTEEAV